MACMMRWKNFLFSAVAMLTIMVVCCYASDMNKERVYITDMAGRKVNVPKEIKRIVPLGAALRYIVYLRAFDKVVGIEAYEQKNKKSPGRPYSLAIADKVDAIPAIGEGGPGKLPDFEKIISVKPDVILAMGIDIDQVETIQKKTGVPVVVLSYGSSIGTLEIRHIINSIDLLGRLLNKESRAEKLTAYIEQTITDLKKRTSLVKEKARTYIGAISFKGSHGITSTEAFYLPLSWVNGNNVADEIGKAGHYFIEPEKLISWNPDFIFIDAGGLGMVADDYKKKPQYYKSLNAVRRGNVFLVLPYNYYHTNLEIAMADAYFMGKVLYPKYFKDINPEKKADEIFKFFNGVEAYNRLKQEFHGFGKVYFEDSGIKVRQYGH